MTTIRVEDGGRSRALGPAEFPVPLGGAGSPVPVAGSDHVIGVVIFDVPNLARFHAQEGRLHTIPVVILRSKVYR